VSNLALRQFSLPGGASVMDMITKSLLASFVSEHQLGNLDQDEQFEHFVTHLIVAGQYSETFDTHDLLTSGGDDTAIDSITIIVNGVLVTDINDLKDLMDATSSLDVSFIFVQATRTPHFDSAKMGQFGNGVTDFFSSNPTLPRNDETERAAQMMLAIYAQAPKFGSKRPVCRMYYATTGKWLGDAHLEARRTSILADVAALEYFSKVTFEPKAATDLQKLHEQHKNSISREFEFEKKATVPAIDGVTEAHLGLISGPELLSVIRNEEGDIVKSIFYDNVRDWLGPDNPVNDEIRKTLSTDARERFSLMNNGVTIIARNLTRVGDRFFIRDFQVVNGCQTCHALFEAGSASTLMSSLDGVWVPLRLIGTQDEELINAIVKATNRQTPVTEEQFFALEEFPKELEKFFETQQGARRLFYERRARQYDSTSYDKTRVVPQAAVARAFAAMFLSEPHATTKSAKSLRGKIGVDLFAPGHKHYPYYVAAVASYKIESRFRLKTLEAKFRVAQYHILLALRLLVMGPDKPKTNSKDMDTYSSKFADVLWGEDAENRIDQAIAAVSQAAAGNLHRDNVRTQAFTESVMAACGASKKPLAAS
jgi:hypothetical protein